MQSCAGSKWAQGHQIQEQRQGATLPSSPQWGDGWVRATRLCLTGVAPALAEGMTDPASSEDPDMMKGTGLSRTWGLQGQPRGGRIGETEAQHHSKPHRVRNEDRALAPYLGWPSGVRLSIALGIKTWHRPTGPSQQTPSHPWTPRTPSSPTSQAAKTL